MKFVLTEDLFTNNEYTVSYGNKKTTFTIVQETYAALGNLANIDRMICTVRTYDDNGELLKTVFGSLVVAIGDANVSVTSDNITLRGKLMKKSMMSECVVELYE